jgi:hypothetical protein
LINKISAKQIAGFLPIAYMIHLCDEYFTGEGFPNWFSGIFDVNLSLNDFLIINSIGFAVTLTMSLLYSLNKVNNFIVSVLGTLFFINGIVHIVASVTTFSYSPGILSGIFVYLPLGYLMFKKIFPLIPQKQRLFPVVIGIIIQTIVAVVAISI